MNPRRVVALAGLLALPAALHAQQTTIPPGQTGPQLPYAKFAITPFVGVRMPISTGSEFLFLNGSHASTTAVSRERGGGVLGGAEAELRFARHWSVVGSAATSARGNDVITTTTTSGSDTVGVDGERYTFAKLGVSFRIPDPNPDARRFHPGGFIVVAPALVRVSGGGQDAVNNFAANVGLAATAPLSSDRRLAFQLGIDDYVTFWNTHKLESRDAAAYSTATVPVVVHYSYNTSNIIVLRVGGSWRV
jgi:hypothetical protein